MVNEISINSRVKSKCLKGGDIERNYTKITFVLQLDIVKSND